MAMNIDKEKVQEVIARLRQLQAQAESYSHQIGAVQASLSDQEKALLTLNAIESMEEGGELLVAIGAGAEIYATLSSKDRIVVGLGGGVSAEKDIKGAIAIITKRQEDLSVSHKRLTEILAGVEAEAQKIEQSLQAISMQMEQQG